MKNKIAIFMLASALLAPSAWVSASAGDASVQGPTATATGTAKPAAAKTVKKHHRSAHHRSKKTTAATTPTASTEPSSSASK